MDSLINITCPACSKKTKLKDLLPSKIKSKWWELVERRKVCPWCKEEMIMENSSAKKIRYSLLSMAFAAGFLILPVHFDIRYLFNNHIDPILAGILFICVIYFIYANSTAKYSSNKNHDKI